ncbi:MAG: hypothetical protein RBG13Loki_2689 [Promethearchaeota archaeon CR_4]|nr:MAG: hypothetical protein RBG13Loki_2689 [Candidatus Lokiarchaeota archaeon CR_4]
MAKKPKNPPQIVSPANLFGPCGMFCGFCTSFLAKKYQIPRRRGIISYCDGCRPRDKKCSFLKMRCNMLLNHKIEYCTECEDFACENLEKIEQKYLAKFKYPYSFKQALGEIQEHGPLQVIERLQKNHGCPKCGEILCIHNGLCYNCDQDQIAAMKNYRNDL